MTKSKDSKSSSPAPPEKPQCKQTLSQLILNRLLYPLGFGSRLKEQPCHRLDIYKSSKADLLAEY